MWSCDHAQISPQIIVTHGEVDLGECPLVTMWSCDHVQISPDFRVTHGEIFLGRRGEWSSVRMLTLRF